MMEFIKDLSVIIGLGVLIYNIGAWHREHKGRRNIELAEETLTLFYEAKDVIKFIRYPGSFSNETESVKRTEGETDGEYHARKNASIVFHRYNNHKDLFNKIHSIRYRFMAQIGKEQAKSFDDLNQIINEIILSARQLARLWPERHFRTEEDKKKHHENIRKAENVFWDTSAEDDPINLRINKVISDIEEICRNIIMAKGTLHGLLNTPLKNKDR